MPCTMPCTKAFTLPCTMACTMKVGIERFNLDRIASNTLASHRLVQWVTKTKGVTAAV